jgi:CHAT domain-containing protein
MLKRRIIVVLICLLASAGSLLSEETPEANLQRGLYFSDLYNWTAARPYIIEARQAFEASGDKRNALYAQLAAIRAGAEPGALPELSYKLGRELAANPILQSDPELRMYCLAVKGEIDGEIDNAAMRRDWTEVSKLAKELGNAKWQYRAVGQLGFADFYDGDLPGAQKKVAEALIGATAIKDIGGQVFFLSATATGLVGQGMNDQALLYADRAIALANATPDAGYPVIAEEARLLAMVNMGQIDAARTELQKVMARSDVQSSHGNMGDLNARAAKLAQIQNDIPGAIAYMTEAVNDVVLVDSRKVIPEYQSELSDLYRLSGNLPKAEALASEAATSAQSFGVIPLIPRLLSVLAEIQIDQHKYIEADHTYDRAAAIQDVMIGNADSVLGKTALIKGASDLYAKHFALIAEHTGNVPKAFAVLEQARGRVMTDLLMSGAKTSPQAVAAEHKIAELRLQLMSAHSDQDIAQLRDAIFLAEQSRSITPEISILKAKEHQTVTLAQLQSSLSPSEAVLEYVVDDPASYCLMITRHNYRIVKLAGKAIISPAVATYLKEVKAKHAARAEARKLFQLLLEPIPEAQNKRQLIIVRDGQLHLVPFDALVNPHDHYVVESQTVVYAPSATSFFLLRSADRPKHANLGLLAIGGVPYAHSNLRDAAITRGYSDPRLSDLPGSEDEARAAVAALPSSLNELLVGNKATETAFKKAVAHSTFHLAVHAIANEARPDRAALVLLSDPANGEDGFLQTSEVVQLPLDADLVVLSACDTAVGPIQGEEGVETLSRAFLLAGARTVVSTLWSIDDDTTLYLMKSFYAQLARKKPVPYALRVAKKSMLSTFGPTKALPYFWAGFTIEGLALPPNAE